MIIKNTKHKKQQCATHPISEPERVAKILENMANPKDFAFKLEYDTNPRVLAPSEIEDKSVDRVILTSPPLL